MRKKFWIYRGCSNARSDRSLCLYHAYELMSAADSIVQIDLSLRRETMKFVLTLDCRPCRIPHEIAELEVACFAFVIDLLHQGPIQSQGLDDRQFGFRMCQRNSPMNCTVHGLFITTTGRKSRRLSFPLSSAGKMAGLSAEVLVPCVETAATIGR